MATQLEQSTARPVIGVPFASDLARRGSAAALVEGDHVVSYTELAEMVAELAQELGGRRGLVGIVGRNELEVVVRYLAALSVGHPVVMATDEEHLGRLMASLGSAQDLHPELALVLSTSGSTGATKCVRLSRRNVPSNAEAIAEYLALSADDRAISSLPLHYCYGLSVLHSHLQAGASLVLSGTSVLDRCFWDAVDRHRVTTLAGVPHTFDLIDRVGIERLHAPSLRRVTQAGGRWAPASVRRYAELGRQRGWDLYVMYGQTEATARMAYLPPADALDRPDCIGRAIPGGALRLAPSEGSDDPDVGELVYSGPNVMMGYATSGDDLARGAELDELHTGDLAQRTEDGLFRIVGRCGRFAKLFGLRLDLDQIEQDLAADGVAALCAEDDQRLVIAAELRPGESERVRRDVAGRLGLPRSAVVVVDVVELPRRPNGKPDHGALARMARTAEVPADDAPRHQETTPVRSVLNAALGLTPVHEDDTFVGLGGDSLSYVEVSIALERALGQLPRDWHRMSVGELEAEHARASARTSGSTSPWWRGATAWLETDVVLRAVAIFLVVGSHTGSFRVRGGAHVLLAVAGYNFARFALRPGRPALDRDRVRSLGRIAVPAAAWLALLTLTTEDYGWQSVLLVNSYLGDLHWSAAWRYWFVEALVLTLVGLLALLSVPWVRRLADRRPLVLPMMLLGAGLIARWDLVQLGPTPEPLLAPHRVVWFFALGWLVAVARGRAVRALVVAVALAAVPGFFGEPARDLVVMAGLLLLVCVPRLPGPRRATAVVGALAGASLYIYLTHWQVYLPLAERGGSPWVGLAASLVVGWALWRLVDVVPARPGAILGRCRQHLRPDLVPSASPRHGPASPATRPTPSAVQPSPSR